MKQLQIGKEYRDGSGENYTILHQAKNGLGHDVYLGVHNTGEGATGMVPGMFYEDGRSISVNRFRDLVIVDWSTLKQDDVVEVETDSGKLVRRHFCRADADSVAVYADGVSSKTYDAAYNVITWVRPERIRRVITTNDK
jgi:hypothetical protein